MSNFRAKNIPLTSKRVGSILQLPPFKIRSQKAQKLVLVSVTIQTDLQWQEHLGDMDILAPFACRHVRTHKSTSVCLTLSYVNLSGYVLTVDLYTLFR